jgi:hypothetical protein
MKTLDELVAGLVGKVYVGASMERKVSDGNYGSTTVSEWQGIFIDPEQVSPADARRAILDTIEHSISERLGEVSVTSDDDYAEMVEEAAAAFADEEAGSVEPSEQEDEDDWMNVDVESEEDPLTEDELEAAAAALRGE